MENFDAKDLLLFIYATVLFIFKDAAVKFKDFAGKYLEVVFNNALYKVKNKDNYLLIQHSKINTLLSDACKSIGSDLGFICMFHNGIAKNFLNYSIRFEYNTNSSLINEYQIKPLSPFYVLLIKLKSTGDVLDTTENKLSIKGTENSLFKAYPIYADVASKVGGNMVGVVLIKLPSIELAEDLDSYLLQIQALIENNRQLVF